MAPTLGVEAHKIGRDRWVWELPSMLQNRKKCQTRSIRQLSVPIALLIIGKVFADLSAFVKLAALNQNTIAVVLVD